MSVGDFIGRILTKVPWINLYREVGNVAIRVHKKNVIPQHSLLINAHYDSAMDSPAASDDAVSCAIMLEVLASIVKEVDDGIFDFDTELIMLFNGGEETFLQASHGFSTQNPWLKKVKGFVNLEAAGSGGREILFQTGPNNPWLVEEYIKSVPYPFGASVADDIFKSGIIPSDTDYKIFLLYGQIPGLDIAYITNGYIYHTTYDKSEYIPDGSILRGGLNVLSLTKALLISEGLKAPLDYNTSTPVFFDIFGIYSFSIPKETNTVICTSIGIIVSLYILFSQGFKGTILSLLNVILSFVCGLIPPLTIAGVLTLSPQGSMAWYSNQWLVIVLYSIPSYIGASVYYRMISSTELKEVIEKEKRLFLGTLTFWVLQLILCIIIDTSNSFLTMLWFLGPFITRGIIGEHMLPLHSGFHIVKICTLTCLGALIPLPLTLYTIIVFVDMMIPITGRMGTSTPSELFIAVLVSFATLMATSFFIPLTMYINSKIFKLISIVSSSVILIFFLLAITQIMFPYSMRPGSPKPKRLFMSYTSQENTNGSLPESFLWVFPVDWLDIQPILSWNHTTLDEAELVHCNKKEFATDCALSPVLPLFEKIHRTYYVKVKERNRVPKPVLTTQSITELNNTTKVELSIRINYRAIMYITTKEGVEMKNWSFEGDPKAILMKDTPNLYFIHIACGVDPCIIDFWIEIEGFNRESENVDIAIGNIWTNEDAPEIIQKVASEMPEWVDIIFWETNYRTWTL